jgi:Leucine-rich repeat (LRR) protein
MAPGSPFPPSAARWCSQNLDLDGEIAALESRRRAVAAAGKRRRTIGLGGMLSRCAAAGRHVPSPSLGLHWRETQGAKPMNAVAKLRWYQFRLRSLFVVMTMACIGMSWVGLKMQQARRQKEAVEAIKGLGGWVRYDYQWDQLGFAQAFPQAITYKGIGSPEPPGPSWLRSLFGLDFFARVVEAVIETDAQTEHLKGLHRLETLYLTGNRVTDVGMARLEGLTQLQDLTLVGSRVTNTGLEHVGGLSQLQNLNVGGTQVTDAGLKHLKGLSQLQGLNLSGTRITDAGLKHLQGLGQVETLNLSGTKVSDIGLEHLRGLSKLTRLCLGYTQVSDTGMEHLKGLSQLWALQLSGTKVTDEGVKRLQQALPNCQIVR